MDLVSEINVYILYIRGLSKNNANIFGIYIRIAMGLYNNLLVHAG